MESVPDFDLICLLYMYSPLPYRFKSTNLACKLEVLNQVLLSTRQLKYGLEEEAQKDTFFSKTHESEWHYTVTIQYPLH